jgi:N-sulfoglucosamine sulfohydrolase
MALFAQLRAIWLLPVISLSVIPSAPVAKAAVEATPARPNILFIILDDWGSKHASAYGCEWVQTPHFDRIAREGALFLNCFTSTPKCGPSRASVLTGRSFFQLEEAANHNGLFPSKFAVYPDLLEQAGYTIGLGAKGWAPGNYELTGFSRNPAGPGFNQHQHPSRPTSGLSRNDYAGNFEAFLQQRPSGKPFSYWMGIYEPHRVYEQGSGVRLGKSLASIQVPAYLPDNDTVRSDLADYAVEVEWADLQIGRTLAALEAAGELDRTVIVVTSDNGMPFPYVKGQVNEDAFHLPLAIRWPGVVQPGRRVHDFVDLRDFAPTFLEIAGLPPHAQMTGKSLVALLQRRSSDGNSPPAPPRSSARSATTWAARTMRAIRCERFAPRSFSTCRISIRSAGRREIRKLATPTTTTGRPRLLSRARLGVSTTYRSPSGRRKHCIASLTTPMVSSTGPKIPRSPRCSPRCARTCLIG